MSFIPGIADLTFLTEDHPEANGRAARQGEVSYSIEFITENLKTIQIMMGCRSYKIFQGFVQQMIVAEQADLEKAI